MQMEANISIEILNFLKVSSKVEEAFMNYCTKTENQLFFVWLENLKKYKFIKLEKEVIITDRNRFQKFLGKLVDVVYCVNAEQQTD